MLLRPVSKPCAAFRNPDDPVWWLPHEAAEEELPKLSEFTDDKYY